MPTVDSSIGSFFILIISCIVIILTVQKHSSAGSTKALSTLSAHITVVVLFFGPLIFFYMWPFPSTHLDKFLAIFDALLTPFLDPVIYTFRKQEMKVAMRRVCWRLISYRMSLSFFFFLFFCFLGPYPWHTEVLSLGVYSELQLPAYTTATATPDLSCVCDLHHSSRQCWILNPLSEARVRTCNLICFCCTTKGTPQNVSLSDDCIVIVLVDYQC